MKVGILSLPLNWNYGGILQQCALRQVLKKMGHDVVVYSRRMDRVSLFHRALVVCKWKFLRMLSELPFFRFHPLVGVQPFKAKYLPELTNDLFDDISMKRITEEMGLDAIIVGSDQVWNCRAAPKLYNYFLDFTEGLCGLRRIAYAASFGKSEWLYTADQTSVCEKLIKSFDAVSVREVSGRELCREYFNISVEHMPDPALLLSRQDYLEMIAQVRTQRKKGFLLTYILDMTEEKQELICELASKLGLQVVSLMPNGLLEAFQWSLRGHHATVEQWLCGFSDADFVVTDSYHGTLFSVLFNKPFITIANQDRGLARFQSFLEVFGLEVRLTYEGRGADLSLADESIDWRPVEAKIERLRKDARVFLDQALQAHIDDN